MFSVVMITKNEHRNLSRLLPVLSGWADEIILYDNSDREQNQSALLAEQYGAKFYRAQLSWAGFGVQRQRAQALATHDWILALDADEVPDETMRRAIRQITDQPPQNTVYGMRRIDYIGSSAIDSPYARIKAHWRLYPKHFGFDDALVHESLVLNGAHTKVLPGYASHHTTPDIAFWLQKRLNYAIAWANDRAHQKRFGVGKIVLHTVGAFFKQYFIDKRFLCGKAGLIYACLFAQYTFNKYALLYAKHRQLPLETELRAQLDHALAHPQSALGWRLPWVLAKRFVAMGWRSGFIRAMMAVHHEFNQRVSL